LGRVTDTRSVPLVDFNCRRGLVLNRLSTVEGMLLDRLHKTKDNEEFFNAWCDKGRWRPLAVSAARHGVAGRAYSQGGGDFRLR
jgi:hypothetical protein